MMAALPGYRLKPFHPAFTYTGVDFFGPFNVTIFRRKVKRWICIFTCVFKSRTSGAGFLPRYLIIHQLHQSF